MLNAIFERLYFVKIGPISVSSAFLHLKKHKIFLLAWLLLGKNQPNFIYSLLILHNQSHAKWRRVYFSFCLCNPAAEECQHFWAVYFLMDWNISWWQNDIICQNSNVDDRHIRSHLTMISFLSNVNLARHYFAWKLPPIKRDFSSDFELVPPLCYVRSAKRNMYSMNH